MRIYLLIYSPFESDEIWREGREQLGNGIITVKTKSLITNTLLHALILIVRRNLGGFNFIVMAGGLIYENWN
jgi:hypothetical protein